MDAVFNIFFSSKNPEKMYHCFHINNKKAAAIYKWK